MIRGATPVSPASSPTGFTRSNASDRCDRVPDEVTNSGLDRPNRPPPWSRSGMWQFFDEKLPDLPIALRVVLFSFLELAVLTCAPGRTGATPTAPARLGGIPIPPELVSLLRQHINRFRDRDHEPRADHVRITHPVVWRLHASLNGKIAQIFDRTKSQPRYL
ncbi:hypothetical protein [Nonomuraea dietziae]|uniref:hypothetical protein n=1 Tax=Nonomuraea dietziae TaxID=65515 RepID=UPI00343E471D